MCHFFVIIIIVKFYISSTLTKEIDSFSRFLEDLDEGVYIQQTLESVLLNDDGKQLMV